MKCVVLMLFLSVACCGFASDYYVDFVSGDDSSLGTSTGTAWKHAHGDTNATGNAASTAPIAGDTVHFKGGSAYVGTLIMSHSGTPASPILFDGNSSGTWGTGRAIIDGNYVNFGNGMRFDANISNIVVKNFEIRNIGGWADDATNVISAAAGTYTNVASFGQYDAEGVYMQAGGNVGITLSDLYIHRIGGWRNTIGWDGSTVHGVAISARGQDSFTITNCEIFMTGYIGIELAALPNLKNILITSCNIYSNINWGVDIDIQQDGGVITNLVITKTRLWDLNQMGGGFLGPNSDLVHQNYIFMRTDDSVTVWTNVVVSRCLFGDPNASPPGSGGTGAIFLSKGPSVDIYNNVFYRPWSGTGIIPVGYGTAPAVQLVRIFNNTFYRGAGGSEIELTGETGSKRRVEVLNNCFVTDNNVANNSPSLNTDSGNGPALCDFNLYYSEIVDVSTKVVRLPDYVKFGGMTAIGYETNGVWGDPKFTSKASYNFAPLPGSATINAGTNLSLFFTVDYLGSNRPASGPWTIGAYEYVSPSHAGTAITVHAGTIQRP